MLLAQDACGCCGELFKLVDPPAEGLQFDELGWHPIFCGCDCLAKGLRGKLLPDDYRRNDIDGHRVASQ